MKYQEAVEEAEKRNETFKAYCEAHGIKNIYWDKDPIALEKEFTENNVFTDNHVKCLGMEYFSLIEFDGQLYFYPSGIMACGDVEYLKQLPVSEEILNSDDWSVASYVDCFGP